VDGGLNTEEKWEMVGMEILISIQFYNCFKFQNK